VFVAFVLLVGLSGGSSRPDIAGLMLLRPAAVLFLVYALSVATAEELRSARMPILIVVALMLLCIVQLIPLPSEIWTALPGRAAVAEASSQIGMAGLARPVSLDPSRTWNTFFALFVPLAAICLVAIQAPSYRGRILPCLIFLGLLSAAIGYLQLVGSGSLQLYEVSHKNAPIGLFANKNHQSVLIVWLMLAVCWVASNSHSRTRTGNALFASSVAALLLLLPLLLLSRSRAGLLISFPGLLICFWLLMRSSNVNMILERSKVAARLVVTGIGLVLFLPLSFLVGALLFSGRDTAVSRFFERDAGEDLRWIYLENFLRMAQDFLPIGSGFGSFQSVFNMYEPTDMLTDSYMNQAHNDPVQLLIEGGIPGVAILAAGLCWFGWAVWRLWRSRQPRSRSAAVFFAGSLALWLMASVVDYPLRTPLVGMLVGALTAHLSFLSSARNLDRAQLSDANRCT